MIKLALASGLLAALALQPAATAPPDVYAVRVLGQPEAVSHFPNTTTWNLPGIVLQAGANTLDVEAIDHDGNGLDDFLVLNGHNLKGPTQLIAFYRRANS